MLSVIVYIFSLWHKYHGSVINHVNDLFSLMYTNYDIEMWFTVTIAELETIWEIIYVQQGFNLNIATPSFVFLHFPHKCSDIF